MSMSSSTTAGAIWSHTETENWRCCCVSTLQLNLKHLGFLLKGQMSLLKVWSQASCLDTLSFISRLRFTVRLQSRMWSRTEMFEVGKKTQNKAPQIYKSLTWSDSQASKQATMGCIYSLNPCMRLIKRHVVPNSLQQLLIHSVDVCCIYICMCGYPWWAVIVGRACGIQHEGEASTHAHAHTHRAKASDTELGMSGMRPRPSHSALPCSSRQYLLNRAYLAGLSATMNLFSRPTITWRHTRKKNSVIITLTAFLLILL